MLLGIKQQNAVFRDDADDHDHAHERGDVEGRARDQQGKEASEGGKQGGEENGGWGGKSPKFKEQHGEEQHKREGENEGKIAERALLLLVSASILDANGGRQVEAGYGFLHGGDAGAEIQALETPGNFNEALKIFAANFRLSGIAGNGGQ